MPLAKSKNSVGLGNTLMNDRFGKGKGADRRKTSAVVRTNHVTGERYVTNDKKEASWIKMRSVTEQGALDEFLATAELAGTDFSAEKTNKVQIIHTDQKNPYLLSAAEERAVLGKQAANRNRLAVPRRPRWDASTTREELDIAERVAFLEWRRRLAEMEETHDLLMTPFERNLEVWRQLWRVIERSDLVVQIVDARNPLLFRSEDLENYVREVDAKKQNLLLINKADMMTTRQRKAWAEYLKGAGIAYRFFSARLAKEQLEEEEQVTQKQKGSEAGQKADQGGLEDGQDADEEAAQEEGSAPTEGNQWQVDGTTRESQPKDDDPSADAEAEDEEKTPRTEEEDEAIRILTVDELESIFLSHAPQGPDIGPDHKMQVGLVGYPNVGKSSTINALCGAKKVSVSSTPGKTKHFQTIHLSERVILCDCPGLVLPNFANTKAELVCNGVLPIDQLREYTGPAALVAQRIPQPFLEAVYGMQIRTKPLEEGGSGVPTGHELLSAYARVRGYMTQGVGVPDEGRAARLVLKDYVNGKLLYCAPPPGYEHDPKEFNAELYDDAHLPEKRRAALAAAEDRADGANTDADDLATATPALPAGPKTRVLDNKFFADHRNGGRAAMPFYHRYSEQGQALEQQGKELTGRKARTMAALEMGINPADLVSSKKHFKGGGKGKKKQIKGDDF